MNLIKNLLLVLLAFVLSILDTSFFSFLPVFGATIISSYVVIINFSITEQISDFLVFTISVILFFSVFSSLPVWFIVLLFLVIPYLFFYVKKSYFPEPSVLFSAVFFALATLLFSFISLSYVKEWNLDAVIVTIYFMIINSAFGVAMYFISKNLRRRFTRKDIKF